MTQTLYAHMNKKKEMQIKIMTYHISWFKLAILFFIYHSVGDGGGGGKHTKPQQEREFF
jgi:hypothetical protein